MIIHNLNAEEIVPFNSEADAKLIIDPNAVLSFPVTIQLFQTVGRRDTQILQASCIVDHDQFPQCDGLNGLRKLSGKSLMIDFFRLPVSKASDHKNSIHERRVYCQWIDWTHILANVGLQ